VTGRQVTLVVTALLFASSAASSHAFLDRAEPRVGSTIKSAPGQVRVWFTERLEPAFSTLEVFDERGERVDTGLVQTDERNPDTLQVPLKSIGPGAYRVKWRVLSVDTHVTEGDFTFRVTGDP
jgi:methionine-rich copper-binding protein CopC